MDPNNVADSADERWSRDGQMFNYDTLGELLDSNDDVQEGDIVHVGTANVPDPAEWVDADDILENLACRADDNCGELAEDYPEVSKEAKAELQDVLEAWARKYCTPTFWLIENDREYIITAEDVKPSDSPEPNPKRGSPPFPEVEAAGGGGNSPDVSNAHSAPEQS